ncbi:MAG: pyridoxal-phosphate dependent enzyme [Lachnospiraceae bacterium]|nr:pyridoxal-phosphate dependent enzyme [Lachnospiraceae bacterium]
MCGSAFAPTPIEFFGNVGGAELYVKRDDLIPVAMGGNKVRIAAEIFAEMSRRGCDAVITYGSVTSNLNRAVALMAKDAGVKCYAIVKQEKGRCSTGTGAAQGCGELTGTETESGAAAAEKLPLNYRLVLASGAEVAETDSAHVGETVARVLAESRARGENPFYVYGDETGHGNEEVLSRAYKEVYGEILRQEQALFDGEYHFTEIFTAVGTGSTISGLIAAAGGEGALPGMTDAGALPGMTGAGAAAGPDGGERHITGISVARRRDAILAAIGPEDERFTITDAYLAGGYGQTAATGAATDPAAGPAPSSLEDFCITTSLAHAMPLDPVYTGKALFGSMEEIKKRGITGKVLFLHTGGTPLYYDMLEK